MKKKKKPLEPEYIPSPMNNPMLNYGVYYMSVSEKILSTLLLLIAGGAVGFVFYGGLFKVDGVATLATKISNLVIFLVVGLIAVKIFLPWLVAGKKKKRDKALRDQFQNLLDSLVTSLTSGSTLQDAFVNARQDLLNQYTEKDHILVELNEILSGIQNGQNIETMLMSFGERSGNEDIQNFSNIIGNCYRMGGDFKSVVRKTRDLIADRIIIADEVATKVSSNKLQHNAMSLMPILIVGLMKAINASLAANLATVGGVLVTTVAVGMFVGAFLWGRKIIDIG